MEDPSQLLAQRVKTLCEHVERLNKQVAGLEEEKARLLVAQTPPTPPPSPPPTPPTPSPPTPPLIKRLNAL